MLSLSIIVSCCVLLLIGYICFGGAVVLAIRDSKNEAEEYELRHDERHWWDFLPYVTEHRGLFLAATVSAFFSVVLFIVGELVW